MWRARNPERLDCGAGMDEALESAHCGAAVFAIWPREGEPFLGRTADLRRRLKRLLRRREQPSRLLNLRAVAERVEYWPVSSRLESALLLYELARHHLAGTYLEFLKLRLPPYVKLVLGNPFPRTHVSSRLTGSGLYYGPFRTAAAAELFEHALLELFQIRRCQEDLSPAPDHPGCIYGEMAMCLRPCQQVVSAPEYASEVARLGEFLHTSGSAALHTAEAARDRMSADLEFEEAARLHKRAERIRDVIGLRDPLVRDVDRLHGVAVLPASPAGTVLLWFMLEGAWQDPLRFDIADTGDTVSMDRRLRDLVTSLAPSKVAQRQRQEHLAILARWYYSSWRDGAWIDIEELKRPPYHKLVGAISRTAHAAA